MAILNFSDVLRKVGLDPSKVKLIRHALTDKGFKACYDADKVYEYTATKGLGLVWDMSTGLHLSAIAVPYANCIPATKCWDFRRTRPI